MSFDDPKPKSQKRSKSCPENVLPQKLCKLLGVPREPTPRLLPGQAGFKWPAKIPIFSTLFCSSETSRQFLVKYSLDLLRMLRRQRQSLTIVFDGDLNNYRATCTTSVKEFYRRFQVLVADFWPEFCTVIEQTAGTSWGTARNDKRLKRLRKEIDDLTKLENRILTGLVRHSSSSAEEFRNKSLLLIGRMEAIVESMVKQALHLRVLEGRQMVYMSDGTPILDLLRGGRKKLDVKETQVLIDNLQDDFDLTLYEKDLENYQVE